MAEEADRPPPAAVTGRRRHFGRLPLACRCMRMHMCDLGASLDMINYVTMNSPSSVNALYHPLACTSTREPPASHADARDRDRDKERDAFTLAWPGLALPPSYARHGPYHVLTAPTSHVGTPSTSTNHRCLAMMPRGHHALVFFFLAAESPARSMS